MSEPHPDARLTLREAFEKHYHKDDLKPSTLERHRGQLATWERLTDDPPVGEITNGTLAAFRAEAIASGLAPATINNAWRTYRAILRLIGPASMGNPWALEIITQVVAMRPMRQQWKAPRRVPLDAIGKLYLAASWADRPVHRPAPDVWRCLVVLAFFTGLRKGDLLRLQPGQFRSDPPSIDHVAGKTGKRDLFPLHPVAQAHIARIREPGLRLFDGLNPHGGGAFYIELQALLVEAGISRDEWFGLHDIRRTAASEIDRACHGIGPTFLQHSPRDVTDRFYLNRSAELRKAILEMRYPKEFDLDPAAARDQAKCLRRFLHDRDEHPRTNPDHWEFDELGFTFRGVRHRCRRKYRLKLLRLLVTSREPVSSHAIADVMHGKPYEGSIASLVRSRLTGLRTGLRSAFGLPRSWNPVPYVNVPHGSGQAGSGVPGQCAEWIVSIPNDLPLRPLCGPDV